MSSLASVSFPPSLHPSCHCSTGRTQTRSMSLESEVPVLWLAQQGGGRGCPLLAPQPLTLLPTCPQELSCLCLCSPLPSTGMAPLPSMLLELASSPGKCSPVTIWFHFLSLSTMNVEFPNVRHPQLYIQELLWGSHVPWLLWLGGTSAVSVTHSLPWKVEDRPSVSATNGLETELQASCLQCMIC